MVFRASGSNWSLKELWGLWVQGLQTYLAAGSPKPDTLKPDFQGFVLLAKPPDLCSRLAEKMVPWILAVAYGVLLRSLSDSTDCD